jgi:hypothetical protein
MCVGWGWRHRECITNLCGDVTGKMSIFRPEREIGIRDAGCKGERWMELVQDRVQWGTVEFSTSTATVFLI